MIAAALLILASGVVIITVLRKPPPDAALAERIDRGGNVAGLAAAPHLLFRDTTDDAYDHLAIVSLAAPDAARGTMDLQCARISYAAGRGICLQNGGFLTTFRAVLFDEQFRPITTLKLDGAPSRARISPDGRFGAITVFVTGQEHGYASASFSTKTTIVDMRGGTVIGDLEQFTTSRDGKPFKAKDFNFWGVTFTRDAGQFYATLMTNRQTYLVRGSVADKTLTVLHDNVECPSLSPDNRLIAYKKRVGGNLAPWRFYTLDVSTMTERPIPGETRSIDDQLEWLDDDRVLYAAQRSSQSRTRDVWVAGVRSGEPARRLVAGAESPVVVR